ncbi:hypothetical protein HK096_007123 [Nowakowskiella sp. JEL0078]|nr:hypothetical protein HK096_007123 [Nowakowskiella sp. JEL0078]
MSKIIIADKLKEHEVELNRLKQVVSDISSDPALEGRIDELFILRYILSSGPGATAETNLRTAIKWRIENAALLKGIREGTSNSPFHEQVAPKIICGIHKQFIDGSPVFIIRSGKVNQSVLFESNTVEQISEWFLFETEKMFDLIDKKSKETGTLIQNVRITDVAGASILNSDLRFIRSQSELGKKADIYYPELLGKAVVINHCMNFVLINLSFEIFSTLASTIDFVIETIKKFAPTGKLEKFQFCKRKATDNDISKCPFASQYIYKEDLPAYLGGSCDCRAIVCGENQ